MCNDKDFENQTKDEKLKTINLLLDKFLLNANDDEKMELMMNIIPKMMKGGMTFMRNQMPFSNSGIPFMKMFEEMSSNMCGFNSKDMGNQNSNASSSSGINNDFGNSEIQTLFEDWVAQVQEEIKNYIKENNDASNKEIAEYLKISEESVKYFIKHC